MVTIKSTANVFTIVLAAGSGSRFGSTKQLAEIDGIPLVRHAMNVATKACAERTVLVAGHEWNSVSDACAPLPGFLIVNENHAEGLGTSIAAAVRSVRHAARAIVVLLADQPLITAEHLQALCAAWGGADDEIVATQYADAVGAPVLFPPGSFEDLVMLCGDAGGRHLLSDSRFKVTKIVFEPAAVDIDTRTDLDQLQGRGQDIPHRK
jgi:molybdenum cofactor cytidylyltransferase